MLKPGGTLSSVGVYGKDIIIPTEAWGAGLAGMDKSYKWYHADSPSLHMHSAISGIRIVTTLCPGGKDRMRRLLSAVESGRVNTAPLITHRFKLDEVDKAYELFANQMDGVIKVAITP